MNEIIEMDGELFPPKAKIKDGERAVGDATEYMKKLYSLAMLTSRELDNYKLDHKYACGDEDEVCLEFAIKCSRLDAKHEIALKMFYACAREAFNVWQENSIGIRAGWKIIVGPARGGPPPELKKLFGFLGFPPEE